MLELIKGLLQREPARLVAYGAAGAVWAVTRLGAYAGVEVPDEITLAVATIVTFVLTEVIRRLVYSPSAVAEIVTQTAPANRPAVATAIEEGTPPAVQPADLPGGR
jgi:hypothetical protein